MKGKAASQLSLGGQRPNVCSFQWTMNDDLVLERSIHKISSGVIHAWIGQLEKLFEGTRDEAIVHHHQVYFSVKFHVVDVRDPHQQLCRVLVFGAGVEFDFAEPTAFCQRLGQVSLLRLR